MRKFIAVSIAATLLGLAYLGNAAQFNGPGDNETYPDTLITVNYPAGTNTVAWTNTLGWTRMVSVGLAMKASIATTATVTVVRSAEGVNDIIATIDATAESFRWTALNQNDVIVRHGDVVEVGSTDTSTNGTVFISLDR
jgi:hypothetical protein